MKRPLLAVGLATLGCLAALVALTHVGWGGFLAFLQAVDRPKPPLFADFTLHYLPTAQQLTNEGLPSFGYFYPPSFAIWLFPLTLFGADGALLAWGLTQIGAAITLTMLAGLALWPEGRAYAYGVAALSALSFPFWHSFRWGQVSVIMTALVVAALVTFDRPVQRSTWAAPLLLALATSIKALPLLFVLPWVARREWRRVLSFAVASGVFLAVLPTLVLGPGKTWEFTQQVRQASAKALATWVPQDGNSQYLPYVVARWLRQPGEAAGSLEAPGVRIAGWLLFLAGLAAAYRLARRDRSDSLLVLGLLFAGLPLILPTSWPHYFVFLPLFQVAMLARAARLESSALRRGSQTVLGASMFLGSVPMLALAGGQPRFSRLGLVCVADLLLLAVMLALASRRPQSTSSTGARRDA